MKKRLIVLSLFLAMQPSLAFAKIPTEETLDIYNQNGIYYYNPSGDENDCESTSTTLAGSSTVEKIWNFFTEHGFNDAQTAGIIGNAIVESNLEPTRSSNGSYWGIFQWGGGRKDAVFSAVQQAGLGQYLDSSYWASSASQNIPDADFDKLLQVELEFALSEQDADWQNEIKKADTPELAAEIFLTLFERAVNGDSEVLYYAPFTGQFYQATKKRRDSAKEVYKQYSGKGISTNSSSAEIGSNITFIGDSITVSAASALQAKFSNLSPDQINATVGRSWQEGIEVAKNSAKLKQTVVFALGTNNEDGLTTALIDEAINAIGDNHTIVFVTNYGSADYTINNQLLHDYANQNNNIIIADWNAAVNQNPFLYLGDDQIHPNSAGNELFADTIYDAVNGNLNANGCDIGGEFQSLVKAYAWPEHHSAPYLNRMPAYAAAVTQSQSEGRYVGGTVGGVEGIDCGGFVTILVQNSGLEPEYNSYKGDTTMQEKWVKNHNWQLLNTGTIDTSILQPGDVAFTSGHTFIYVGEIPGFDSVIASASYSTNGISSGRAPMAGKESLTSGTRWYRNPNYHPTSNVSSLATGQGSSSGTISNSQPTNATLLSDHHVTFYSAVASENGGYAGRNASNDYNNGYLAPGQAASSYLPLGTVVYVQTQASGEASYANGKYFLITDRGAGKINGDYDLDIFHDVATPSDNNYPPYGSSSTAKIWKVAEGVSWETFKAKYGW